MGMHDATSSRRGDALSADPRARAQCLAPHSTIADRASGWRRRARAGRVRPARRIAPSRRRTMPIIVVEQLVKTFRAGRVRALDGVTLALEPGEAIGIIGPNGAGKTTLFGCLLGFLRPDSGTVTIDGRAADDLVVRARTGYLPERLVMDRWMTGFDFLAYHHALARLPVATRRADCIGALERVGLDQDAGARSIRAYSRGMLQRLGLAQA